jgi:hypothetical protein
VLRFGEVVAEVRDRAEIVGHARTLRARPERIILGQFVLDGKSVTAGSRRIAGDSAAGWKAL